MGCKWWWSWALGFAAWVAPTLGLSGCGTDLGSCDQAALAASVTASGAYQGQQVLGLSCASGRCHSIGAVGSARLGAPADLNFDVTIPDMLQAALALATVREEVEDIWSEVDDGAMPPAPPAGAGPLDSTSKEALRNWLACGAPPGTTSVPTTDDWSAVVTALSTTCAGCHGAATFSGIGEGFLLSADPCEAYMGVVNMPAITMTGGCGTSGALIVSPGNPDASLLLQKLEQATPSCGSPMPLGTGPLGAGDPTVIRLRSWIAAGAPPPAGCQP